MASRMLLWLLPSLLYASLAAAEPTQSAAEPKADSQVPRSEEGRALWQAAQRQRELVAAFRTALRETLEKWGADPGGPAASFELYPSDILTEVVREASSAKTAALQRGAVSAAAFVDRKQLPEVLTKFYLRGVDAEVRQEAWKSLRKLEPSQVVPHLVAGLKHETPRSRILAARALKTFPDPSAARAVAEALERSFAEHAWADILEAELAGKRYQKKPSGKDERNGENPAPDGPSRPKWIYPRQGIAVDTLARTPSWADLERQECRKTLRALLGIDFGLDFVAWKRWMNEPRPFGTSTSDAPFDEDRLMEAGTE